MKEIIELRINYEYADLLFERDEGRNLGTSVKIVELTREDPRYHKIPVIAKQIQQNYNKAFFFGWEIKRKYSKKELDAAELFHMKVKTTFEPAGQECGTIYDETVACNICGANRDQRSSLILKRGSVPNKDIAKTIAGEVVVSKKFELAFRQRALKGALLDPIVMNKVTSNYFQLASSIEVNLSQNTVAGVNPFDMSTKDQGEIYKCPMGHTIGLNLLSELFILNSELIAGNDLIVSKQKIGVKRGLLRPEPVYFCSQSFREMVNDEKLSGFEFEVAHIM
ncbi:hypothetical protein [Dyadobacter aurulentus]|uniref:hypothetical protein n=1 Tax=Dyadobacter sp. UC 10 TaxID=2605428 RepID=UPI0011F3E157|nr:hypothetical protein [Dyadobacter sp. UC 10]KAA0990470.1 hypothetical protein FXO21_10040 [Dyadobacter sp. UC 10]